MSYDLPKEKLQPERFPIDQKAEYVTDAEKREEERLKKLGKILHQEREKEQEDIFRFSITAIPAFIFGAIIMLISIDLFGGEFRRVYDNEGNLSTGFYPDGKVFLITIVIPLILLIVSAIPLFEKKNQNKIR